MGKAKSGTKNILHFKLDLRLPPPIRDGSESIVSLLKQKRESIVIGINQVFREASKGGIKMIVVSRDINPPEIIQHVLVLCDEQKIPVIRLALPSEEFGKGLGVRRASAVGIKSTVDEDTYNLFVPFGSVVEEPDLPCLHIETSKK